MKRDGTCSSCRSRRPVKFAMTSTKSLLCRMCEARQMSMARFLSQARSHPSASAPAQCQRRRATAPLREPKSSGLCEPHGRSIPACSLPSYPFAFLPVHRPSGAQRSRRGHSLLRPHDMACGWLRSKAPLSRVLPTHAGTAPGGSCTQGAELHRVRALAPVARPQGPAPPAKRWEVVGGSDKGGADDLCSCFWGVLQRRGSSTSGILVREGQSTTSKQLADRLSTGGHQLCSMG